MNRWIEIKWRTRNLLCSCSEATRFLFLDFFLLCGRCQTLTWRIEESVAWSLKKRERSWLEKVWEKKEINMHKLNASFWLTFCPSTPSIVSCVLCSSISTVTIGLQDLSGRMRRMPSRRITVSKKNSRLVIPQTYAAAQRAHRLNSIL